MRSLHVAATSLKMHSAAQPVPVDVVVVVVVAVTDVVVTVIVVVLVVVPVVVVPVVVVLVSSKPGHASKTPKPHNLHFSSKPASHPTLFGQPSS
mmetsp:Transcript_46598/g.132435  ORF Transcript_46598/g.132435 Transcript_46598/m.132435 type:complete len:94 (+) Transcript_46598:147-428(+)